MCLLPQRLSKLNIKLREVSGCRSTSMWKSKLEEWVQLCFTCLFERFFDQVVVIRGANPFPPPAREFQKPAFRVHLGQCGSRNSCSHRYAAKASLGTHETSNLTRAFILLGNKRINPSNIAKTSISRSICWTN
jgi:hypothetical protein